jgi:hypothetical protein
MLIPRPLFVLVAVVSLQADPARAWGPEGHRIVAHIAERRLSDGARAAIGTMLAPDQEISDNMVCNWPDYIKHDEPESGPWHYVDIPYEASSYVAQRDCTNGQCIVEQITHFELVLADPKASPEDRHRALAFVVHFLGDVHQPLHCISRDDDQGGNLRPVRWPGVHKPTNLHSLWDSNLVRSELGTQSALDYADDLNAKITPRQARIWAKGRPVDWALEGHALAVKLVYRGVPTDGSKVFEPDRAYIDDGRAAVESQLMKAGIRLAAVLNRALK